MRKCEKIFTQISLAAMCVAGTGQQLDAQCLRTAVAEEQPQVIEARRESSGVKREFKLSRVPVVIRHPVVDQQDRGVRSAQDTLPRTDPIAEEAEA